jgi:hypothetical protein
MLDIDERRTGILCSGLPQRLPDTSATRDLTTAEALFKSLHGGLPGDVDIRRDFGFDRCVSLREESNLLGLYQGLHLEELDPLVLDTWHLRGTISENIKRFYERWPYGCRGGYYPWIQANMHILE